MQIILASLPVYKTLLLSFKDVTSNKFDQGALTIHSFGDFCNLVIKNGKNLAHFFSSFTPCLSLPKDDAQQFQYLNVLLQSKPGPLLFEFN